MPIRSSKKSRAAARSKTDKGQRVTTQRESASMMSSERNAETHRRQSIKLKADTDPGTGRPRR